MSEGAEHQPHEKHVRHQISRAEPPWFLDEAEKPFQSGALHPGGSARGRAGEDVDRTADTHDERNGQELPMLVSPVLLAGRAHCDEQDRDVGTIDGCADLCALDVVEIAVVKAADAKTRMRGAHVLDSVLQYIGPPAEKEHPEVLALGDLQKTEHQVDARNPFWQRVAE